MVNGPFFNGLALNSLLAQRALLTPSTPHRSVLKLPPVPQLIHGRSSGIITPVPRMQTTAGYAMFLSDAFAY